MSILIFGGTTEGRLLARELSRRGLPAWVSVATPLGAEELSGLPGITPLVGRKTAGEMAGLLQGFSRCVDATHPYAAEVSANIRTACAEAGVPLRRLLRDPGGRFTGIRVDSPEEAAACLSERWPSAPRGCLPLPGGIPHASIPGCCRWRRVWRPAAGRGSPPGTSSPCTGPSPGR